MQYKGIESECAKRLDIVAGKSRTPNGIGVTECRCADRDTRTWKIINLNNVTEAHGNFRLRGGVREIQGDSVLGETHAFDPVVPNKKISKWS